MGIAYLGIRVGGMRVPQIAKWFNLQLVWRSSLVMLGILKIVFVLPIALFVKENPEEKLKEIKVDEVVQSFKSILKIGFFIF